MSFRDRPPSVSMTPGADAQPVTAMRQYVRVPVDLAATYVVSGRDGRRAARIDDLSAGGVRLETDEDLPAGTVVLFQFSLDGTAIDATGRIALSFFDGARKRFLHGVAFTAIAPAQLESIAAHVQQLGG